MGITQGDIARFSLVSVDTPELVDNPNLRCDGRAIFLDAQGAVLATHPFELRAGEGTFFDLSLADVRQRPGNRDRLTLRPAYQPAGRNECQLLPTLEILDARSMQTRFVHPLARVGFNPQPDPPFEG